MAEETAQMKLAREQAGKTGVAQTDWPRDAFGTPLVKISCAQSELIPTKQYANVTIGPVQVTRFVPDGPAEQLQQHLRDTQALCDRAISEDRETLHTQLRAAAGGQ